MGDFPILPKRRANREGTLYKRQDGPLGGEYHIA
jgi:hypothetical protein